MAVKIKVVQKATFYNSTNYQPLTIDNSVEQIVDLNNETYKEMVETEMLESNISKQKAERNVVNALKKECELQASSIIETIVKEYSKYCHSISKAGHIAFGGTVIDMRTIGAIKIEEMKITVEEC